MNHSHLMIQKTEFILILKRWRQTRISRRWPSVPRPHHSWIYHITVTETQKKLLFRSLWFFTCWLLLLHHEAKLCLQSVTHSVICGDKWERFHWIWWENTNVCVDSNNTPLSRKTMQSSYRQSNYVDVLSFFFHSNGKRQLWWDERLRDVTINENRTVLHWCLTASISIRRRKYRQPSWTSGNMHPSLFDVSSPVIFFYCKFCYYTTSASIFYSYSTHPVPFDCILCCVLM